MIRAGDHIPMDPRGLAVINAIKAGLLPQNTEGYDDSAFNLFWEMYTVSLREYAEK